MKEPAEQYGIAPQVMRSDMNLFIKKIDKIISIVLSVLVAVLSIGVICGVFLRYFFGISYAWMEEFLTIMFVYTIFLGSALCIREHQHIGISYFVDNFKGVREKISLIFIQVVITFVACVLCLYSIRWITAVGSTLSADSHVPVGIFYTIVPVSSVITVFYCLINIAGNFIHIDEAVTGYFEDDALPEEMNP